MQAVEEARVGRVRVAAFSVSLDGFGAGPEQSLQHPLGKRGTELHGWFFGTKTFKAMFGDGGVGASSVATALDFGTGAVAQPARRTTMRVTLRMCGRIDTWCTPVRFA